MVPAMNRNLRTALVVLGLAASAVIPAVFESSGCTASTSPPACTALANCCANPNVDDPSSCSETAMSGEYTDAQCGAVLQMYQANGVCEGGVPDAKGQ